MRTYFFDKDNINYFTEFVLYKLIVQNIEDFGGKCAVLPIRISFNIQNLRVTVFFYYFFKNWELILSKYSSQLSKIKDVFKFDRELIFMDELLAIFR